MGWKSGADGTRCHTILAAARARRPVGLGIDKLLVAFKNSYVHRRNVTCKRGQRVRIEDIERRESILGISHVTQQLSRGTLLGCRPTKQIQYFLVIPRIVNVLARVEQILLEGRRNIVVDVRYCNVILREVFGIHVQGLIAVASQLAVQSSHVVPAGRATSCELRHGF